MLTHEIVRYSVPPVKKQKFRAGSDEHRMFIFSRTLEETRGNKRYRPGRAFKVRGKDEHGILMDIIDDIRFAEWEGLKVKFIELYFCKEQDTALYHPSDLKDR